MCVRTVFASHSQTREVCFTHHTNTNTHTHTQTHRRLILCSSRLLEVGAVNTQLLSCRWLDVTPIDLRSQHPKIAQIDFLQFANPVEDGPYVCLLLLFLWWWWFLWLLWLLLLLLSLLRRLAAICVMCVYIRVWSFVHALLLLWPLRAGGCAWLSSKRTTRTMLVRGGWICSQYDFLSCAMVLNCVPTPQKRGAMLLRSHALLKERGTCDERGVPTVWLSRTTNCVT